MYFKGEPLYPFGYGLSYTTFQYSNIKTTTETLAKDGTIMVSADVENSGQAAGEEVVQLYVKDVQPDTDLRIRMLSAFASEQLRGFQRVELKPGQRKTVQIPLPAKWLEHWDMTRHAFVLEPGRIELRVGASSADIRLTKTIAVGN